MKNVFVLLMILSSIFVQAQTCCEEAPDGKEANDAFVKLGDSEVFKNDHKLPVLLDNFAKMGKFVEFSVTDGTPSKAYFVKAKKETNKYLIVFHEWWGLNDNIIQEADIWSKKLKGKVNILAVDLYDGKVGTTREEASNLMKHVNVERANAIVQGAIGFAGANAKFATIGWCFGGGWSHQAAIVGGKQNVGCVIYYGMPEKDVERLRGLNTDVLAIFATKDAWINQEVADDFQNAMTKAGKSVSINFFEADHAFANPSSGRYNEAAAKAANKLTLKYLKKHLR